MKKELLSVMMALIAIILPTNSWAQENIQFADNAVKAICIANWDTNGDGELSYDEAAAVTDIGKVFKSQNRITSFNELEFFTGLTAIADSAFAYCTRLEEAALPPSVKSIGNAAFVSNDSLTYVEMHEGLESIGSSAFSWCSKLTSVIIPSTVTSIGTMAYNGSTNMEYLHVEENNPVYDSRHDCNAIIETATNTLIAGCKRSIIVEGVVTIGEHAFSECAIENVLTLPTSLRTIGDHAFSYSNLTSLVFQEGLVEIKEYAFYGCYNLRNVDLPNTLERLNSFCFSDCNMERIYIPASVTYIGVAPFASNNHLAEIVVDEANPNYESGTNNAIINKSYHNLIQGSNTTIIPSGTRYIGNWSFSHLTDLKTINNPEGVLQIVADAFYGCTGLEIVTLPSTISDIGTCAFYDCPNIREIHCFVKEPKSFSLEYDGSFGSNQRNNIVYNDATLYVPYGTKALYESTDGWNRFKNIMEMEPYAMDYCPDNNHPHVIDFGLSSGGKVLCRNLGAKNPEKIGETFTWDEFMALRLDEGYRTLTEMEISEIVNSEYQFTEINGTQGQLITGRNGNTIFLPLGDYWSSDVNEDGYAYYMYVREDIVQWARTDKSEKKHIRLVFTGDTPVIHDFEPYAVLSDNSTAMTFYYDDLMEARGGTNFDDDDWNSSELVSSLTALVFDSSFEEFVESEIEDFEMSLDGFTSLAAVKAGSIRIPNEEYAKVGNPNLLVYVNEASLAPQGVQNVVINGQAKEIILTDAATGNNNWYCPQAFTAEKISYTRNFSQRTEIGVSRGWESIALPFDVKTITHETKGSLAPFGTGTGVKHFWLRTLSQNGMTSARSIEAYKPYVISMPNNTTAYSSEYNLNGRVTFSASNTTVPATPDMDNLVVTSGEIMMAPAYQSYNYEEIYAINVGQARGNYAEGSVFERGLREVRPFEAFTVHEGQGARPRYIPITAQGNESTGIESIEQSTILNSDWYDLSGRKLSGEPKTKGVYIQNGKKIRVK